MWWGQKKISKYFPLAPPHTKCLVARLIEWNDKNWNSNCAYNYKTQNTPIPSPRPNPTTIHHFSCVPTPCYSKRTHTNTNLHYVVTRHSFIVVYVHPQHFAGVFSLAWHEVVIWREISWTTWLRSETSGTSIVGGISHGIGRRRRGWDMLTTRQTVSVCAHLPVIGVARRAPTFGVVVIKCIVSVVRVNRWLAHIILPLRLTQKFLLKMEKEFRMFDSVMRDL